MTDGSAHRSTAVLRELQREDHPAPDRARVDPRALWFGVLGAPVAWSIHTVFAASLNSFGCLTGVGAEPPSGERIGTAIWVGLLLVSAVLLVIAVAAAVVSWHNWRRARTNSRFEGEEVLEVGEGRTRFMAMGGTLMGVLFSLLLAANVMPLFLASQCMP